MSIAQPAAEATGYVRHIRAISIHHANVGQAQEETGAARKLVDMEDRNEAELADGLALL
jgi:hypothetical protein